MRHLRFIVFVVYLVAITAFALLNFRKTDREIELAIERKSYDIKRKVEQPSAAVIRAPLADADNKDKGLPSIRTPQLPIYRSQSNFAGVLFDQAARAASVVQLIRKRPRPDAQLTSDIERHTEEVRRKLQMLQQSVLNSSEDVNRAARDAEPSFTQLLETLESVLGPDHPEVASGSQNLATLYYLQERYEDAEPLYKRALNIWERVPDQQRVAGALEGYAMLLRKMARSEEALEMETRSLSIRKLHPPENSGSSELTVPGESRAGKPA